MPSAHRAVLYSPVSKARLQKTGISQWIAGDFREFSSEKFEHRVSGDSAMLKKPAVGGPFCSVRRIFSDFQTGWLGNLDSNQDKQSQSLLCYRYTIPQSIADRTLRAGLNRRGGSLAKSANRCCALDIERCRAAVYPCVAVSRAFIEKSVRPAGLKGPKPAQ